MRKILLMLIAGAILLVFSAPILAVDRVLELRVVGQKPLHQAGGMIVEPKGPAPAIFPKAEPVYRWPSVVRTDLDVRMDLDPL